jgi:hypothetical protein
MATSKKTAGKPAPASKISPKKKGVVALTIDIGALEKLYKGRYSVRLDGGDTKSGILIRDGDTKGGVLISSGSSAGPGVVIQDGGGGDTKGGPEFLPPKRGTPNPKRPPTKKASPKKT